MFVIVRSVVPTSTVQGRPFHEMVLSAQAVSSPKPPEHFLVSNLVILPVLPPSVVSVACSSHDIPETPDSNTSPPVSPSSLNLVTFTPDSFQPAAEAEEAETAANIVTATAMPARRT